MTMNRMEKTFARLKQEGRAGLVGYLTAGDPDLETSRADCRTALVNGVDILELGVPFSDPTADGPVIQAASQRALAAGMTLKKAMGLAGDLRREFPDKPIILFGYANPFYRQGYAELARDAAAAGVDGFLVVDIPWEESGELRRALKAEGLCLIPLIAPTTSVERAKKILNGAAGFVYYILVRGVTGGQSQAGDEAREHLTALRTATKLPIAAGFGIRDGCQAATYAGLASAVVVGSALVEAARTKRLAEKVTELHSALAITPR